MAADLTSINIPRVDIRRVDIPWPEIKNKQQPLTLQGKLDRNSLLSAIGALIDPKVGIGSIMFYIADKAISLKGADLPNFLQQSLGLNPQEIATVLYSIKRGIWG